MFTLLYSYGYDHQATLIEFLIKAISLQNVAIRKYVKCKYYNDIVASSCNELKLDYILRKNRYVYPFCHCCMLFAN